VGFCGDLMGYGCNISAGVTVESMLALSWNLPQQVSIPNRSLVLGKYELMITMLQ
jgi:hypothetical protein